LAAVLELGVHKYAKNTIAGTPVFGKFKRVISKIETGSQTHPSS
jgi:hypothetical protein